MGVARRKDQVTELRAEPEPTQGLRIGSDSLDESRQQNQHAAAERRLRAIHAVQTMRRKMALLAEALNAQGAAAANVEMALQSDLSVTEIMSHAPIAETRFILTERAIAFDTARKAARHAIIALMLDEDFTIANIAQVFGVSRQLASRLANEVRLSTSAQTSLDSMTSTQPPETTA